MNVKMKSRPDFSLTDKTLEWLCNQNKNCGNIYSFTVVHLFGSALLLSAGISDTLIRSTLTVATALTGCVASPFDSLRGLIRKPPLLQTWSWSKAIDHAASAIKQPLFTPLIVLENLFSGPESTRRGFYGENIEYQRGLVLKQQLEELSSTQKASKVKTPQPPVLTPTPLPVIPPPVPPMMPPLAPTGQPSAKPNLNKFKANDAKKNHAEKPVAKPLQKTAERQSALSGMDENLAKKWFEANKSRGLTFDVDEIPSEIHEKEWE